jgi:hypothetical protein
MSPGARRTGAVTLIVLACCQVAAGQAGQLAIERVERMPNLPSPYAMRDWAKVARDYDAMVFDPNRSGEHMPFLWWDRTRHNRELMGFGLPSYVGSPYQRSDNHHESINCMAAVTGASLVGINKSRQGGRDFVSMCRRYFNRDNGQGLYLNSTTHGTGGSFWYETYPSILFAHLYDLYPEAPGLAEDFAASADRMIHAIDKLRGPDGVVDFDHTAFNYTTLSPADNGRWKESDAAGGYAWFQYMAPVRTGQAKYLRAAETCMEFLQKRPEGRNPYYEVNLPYGAVLAARMNAELGRSYDLAKLLRWCFGPSDARPGFGVIADRWGEVDAGGLTGSLTDGGGYAFAMNTFDQVATLAPVARYDDRYARAIGKYVLNAANSARLFYANAYTDDRQNCAAWARRNDPDYCIAYEGCRKRGRRSTKVSADFRTTAGRIASGSYKDTFIWQEMPQTAYEVLTEQVEGDHDSLEHVWAMKLAEGTTGRWLHVVAHRSAGGDANDAFRFDWANDPNGPYKPMFTVTQTGQDKHYYYGLPADLKDALYLKVSDTDRTAGHNHPDSLYVDCIFVMYEIPAGPFGMGDGGIGGFPRATATDFGLYGSSHVGYLGGMVATTDVEGILRIDLLRTDWHHAKAYPTCLYYNPYSQARTVHMDVGKAARDVYDAVTDRFLARAATGVTAVTIQPDSAIVVVLVPAGGNATRQGRRLLIDGEVVDYDVRRDGGQ